ncbi:HD domain-containing protein [Methanoplanus limicola]|uniref:Metal dependent phosphohydrolase n=1 Tax=Methanoplanus limicola DSM 2279 TaxID=937775 RepID=H1Z460_9EURY|nr:HD domain-containing protein [Methanoplanus limicola]EHQ35739.1 metal dependent phosphohydrolase [Methanoplanus limicola DSM 2279]
MKFIKDPVHGYVEVPGEILPFLDSSAVQRLRYVKQLGFSHLVYPGANHTRFEHSLGTMHLAGVMAKNLMLSAHDTTLVSLAGLLHDIGHGPFSHATESLMEKYIGRQHHEIRSHLKKGELAVLFEQSEISPDELYSIIGGEHNYAGIIHGELDVDRMDYLLRDAHYSGVPYGTVDAQRLIHSTIISEKGLVLKKSGINAAESLLIARTLMRPAVYYHHVSRIAEAMVKAAAEAHLLNIGTSEAERLFSLNDPAFMMEVSTSDSDFARELMERLSVRRLYKRSIYAGIEQLRYSSVTKMIELGDESGIKKAICEACGLDDDKILVDIPSRPSFMNIDVNVGEGAALTSLEDLSPLVNTLNETRKSQWRIGIYTPEEYRKSVEDAACDVLDIRKPTRQDKLNL